MKEESTSVATSHSNTATTDAYKKAWIIGEIKKLESTTPSADFEQGFKKAKEMAIKIVMNIL